MSGLGNGLDLALAGRLGLPSGRGFTGPVSPSALGTPLYNEAPGTQRPAGGTLAGGRSSASPRPPQSGCPLWHVAGIAAWSPGRHTRGGPLRGSVPVPGEGRMHGAWRPGWSTGPGEARALHAPPSPRCRFPSGGLAPATQEDGISLAPKVASSPKVTPHASGSGKREAEVCRVQTIFCNIQTSPLKSLETDRKSRRPHGELPNTLPQASGVNRTSPRCVVRPGSGLWCHTVDSHTAPLGFHPFSLLCGWR